MTNKLNAVGERVAMNGQEQVQQFHITTCLVRKIRRIQFQTIGNLCYKGGFCLIEILHRENECYYCSEMVKYCLISIFSYYNLGYKWYFYHQVLQDNHEWLIKIMLTRKLPYRGSWYRHSTVMTSNPGTTYISVSILFYNIKH